MKLKIWNKKIKIKNSKLKKKNLKQNSLNLWKSGDGTHPVFGHHMSEVPPPDDMMESNDHLKSS